jgi:hypothetical protein
VFGLNPVHAEVMRPINQVLFTMLSNALLGSEVPKECPEKRAWLILDELREAGKLEGLSSLLNQGRSKNVSLSLGFQDIVGLQAVYRDEALEITGQCRNKSFLPTTSSETAHWVQNHFKEAMHLDESNTVGESTSFDGTKLSTSWSWSRSYQQNLRSIVLASEVLGMKLPTATKGFSGLHDVPSFGSFFAYKPWKETISLLCPPDKEAAGELKRPYAHEVLRPWGPNDDSRLGLDSLSSTESKQKEKGDTDRFLLEGIG